MGLIDFPDHRSMFLWPKLWDIPELDEPTQDSSSDCESDLSKSSCSRIEIEMKSKLKAGYLLGVGGRSTDYDVFCYFSFTNSN